MYRILLCFLMAMSVESFINRTRVVRQAKDILLRHLVEKNYAEFDKDDAYLSMLNAFYHPALALAHSEKHFSNEELKNLYTDASTADVISNKFVRELKDIVRKNTIALAPLTNLIDEQCVLLSDKSCNKLIKTLQGNGKHPDLERSVAVLDKSYNAAKVFLGMNHYLENFAEKLSLRIPYKPNMEFNILFFADWIREFGLKSTDNSSNGQTRSNMINFAYGVWNPKDGN